MSLICVSIGQRTVHANYSLKWILDLKKYQVFVAHQDESNNLGAYAYFLKVILEHRGEELWTRGVMKLSCCVRVSDESIRISTPWSTPIGSWDSTWFVWSICRLLHATFPKISSAIGYWSILWARYKYDTLRMILSRRVISSIGLMPSGTEISALGLNLFLDLFWANISDN